jgi:NAD(P)-dependent dehydrogenase (short-subunit alcohol dehydrogenase family)
MFADYIRRKILLGHLPTQAVGIMVTSTFRIETGGGTVADSGTIVVVGGSSGIGEAVASELAESGQRVLVLDVVKGHAGHPFVQVDLRSQESIDQALEALDEHQISGVAHVAGLPGTRPGADVLGVNFLGLRHFLQGLAPKLPSGSAIAVVASTAGSQWTSRIDVLEPLLGTASMDEGQEWLVNNPSDYPIYSTSKEAVILFSKRWSYSLFASQGVRLNTISPGPVETPILGDFEESMGKDVLDGVRTMVGRHGRPGDVAGVVRAALGPAFGWVNGQDIQVDGGATSAFMSGALNFTPA